MQVMKRFSQSNKKRVHEKNQNQMLIQLKLSIFRQIEAFLPYILFFSSSNTMEKITIYSVKGPEVESTFELLLKC